jgi:hypothetical protein
MFWSDWFCGVWGLGIKLKSYELDPTLRPEQARKLGSLIIPTGPRSAESGVLSVAFNRFQRCNTRWTKSFKKLFLEEAKEKVPFSASTWRFRSFLPCFFIVCAD